MAGKGGFRNPVAVGDLTGEVLDPLLRRRAGMSVALIQSWDEVVGARRTGSAGDQLQAG